MNTKKRRFGWKTIVALDLLCACTFLDTVEAQKSMNFIRPIDGDMLCAYDGKEVKGALLTTVTVSAAPGSRITINGIDAIPSGDAFIADISLKEYRNHIELLDATTGDRQTITRSEE